jgi:hypothetical protein
MPIILSRNNNKGRRDILIVLGPENIERMQNKDPFELRCWEFPWKEPVGLVSVVCATHAELIQIEQLTRQGKTKEAIELATSGFEYRPDLGDHDRGPERIST